MKTSHPKSTQEIVNESGYPLQILLQSIIQKESAKLRWSVLVSEHRWESKDTNEEGFIDLVLTHQDYLIRLVIECKRFDGSWIFLFPDTNPSPDSHVILLHNQYEQEPLPPSWTQQRLSPASFTSNYCVSETGGKRDGRTLEELSSHLLLSLENLAWEELLIRRKLNSGWHNMFYLPIIVTTATLQTCLFAPDDVDIIDGRILQSQSSTVDYIRFRKNLSTTLGYDKLNVPVKDLKAANMQNERSIVVVRAEALTNFLTNFEM